MGHFGNGLIIATLAGAAVGIVLARFMPMMRRSGIMEFCMYAGSLLFLGGISLGLEPETRLCAIGYSMTSWITCAMVVSIVVVSFDGDLRRRLVRRTLDTFRTFATKIR